jgi:hypothetical protein
MRVRCFAGRCSYPVNSSKILAVRNDMKNTADTLRNVILSRHSIRDARNLSHVCSDCCYGATGGSLTAREATCTHVCHMRVHSKHKVPKRPKIIMMGPRATTRQQLQKTRSAKVEKAIRLSTYSAAPQ